MEVIFLKAHRMKDYTRVHANQTCPFMKSSLLSAKKCRAIILLRSRIHCLSPWDNPNNGREAGRKGTPSWLLLTNECKKLDNTLWGGPATCKWNKMKSTRWITKAFKIAPSPCNTGKKFIKAQKACQFTEFIQLLKHLNELKFQYHQTRKL